MDGEAETKIERSRCPRRREPDFGCILFVFKQLFYERVHRKAYKNSFPGIKIWLKNFRTRVQHIEFEFGLELGTALGVTLMRGQDLAKHQYTNLRERGRGYIKDLFKYIHYGFVKSIEQIQTQNCSRSLHT